MLHSSTDLRRMSVWLRCFQTPNKSALKTSAHNTCISSSSYQPCKGYVEQKYQPESLYSEHTPRQYTTAGTWFTTLFREIKGFVQVSLIACEENVAFDVRLRLLVVRNKQSLLRFTRVYDIKAYRKTFIKFI